MSNIIVRRQIAASPAAVWRVLADFGGIASWNPNLRGSHLLEGSANEGEGAMRQCDLSDGKNWIRERVVAWEEGRSLTVDIYEGTMPLQSASATLGVQPLPDGGSEAWMEFDYTVKMGVLGALMDVVMMKSMMRKNMDRLLEGLEEGSARAA